MATPTAKHLFITPNGFEYVLYQEGTELTWRFRPLGETKFVFVPGSRSVLRSLLEDASSALVYYDSALNEDYFDADLFLSRVHLRAQRNAEQRQPAVCYGAAI